MFSFTKKSFSFKVYITGNREFLPRKPQIYLIYSSKLQDKFSVSHCEIQKPQCGIYISQWEIQIPQCETENSSKRSELCFSEFVIICGERWNFLIEIIGYAINLYNFILQVYRSYD